MNRSLPLIFAAVCGFAPAPAGALDLCFKSCLTPRMSAPDMDDRAIREALSACRSQCEDEAKQRLAALGEDESLRACAAAPLSEAEFRRVRSASPSVVGVAGAFLWEVDNVLPDKIIRRVEISTQNMELQEVVMGAGGYAAPGERATFMIGHVADGYPAVRLSSRVRAIYACPAPQPAK
ncbi:hypothetical protein [Methylocella sp.]|uniref:hypothetical protein n=1 Tax=Methylocella sp. TaxID=1978226 RepID=UPI003784FD56